MRDKPFKKLFGWATTTLIAVFGFVVVLHFMMRSEKANAEPYVGLGHTIIHSSVTSGELGYRFGRYGFAVEATGEGETDKGPQGFYPILSAYRVVDPRWCYRVVCLKSALGAAYTPNQLLIGEWNYRLELIAAFYDWEFYLKHYSSAGGFKNNTGLDVAGLRLVF